MIWEYWIDLFTGRHCTARGLRAATIDAYRVSLEQFHGYVRFRLDDRGPGEIAAVDVLGYIEHLRTERGNGDSAVNRHVVILRSFYRAIVAMDHLEPAANPMAHFPRIRAVPRKLPRALSEQEVDRLLATPEADTVLGIRDRALLCLLYATGIRVSECAGLRERDVDLVDETVFVTGKGGHQRTVPLNETAVRALAIYRRVRGPAFPAAPFFRSRRGTALSRGAIYERVRTHGQRARLAKPVSPHTLRHTFATHMVRGGEKLPVVRDLLGHRCISSTELYMHMTARDLRAAADRHPIGRMLHHLDTIRLGPRVPMQHVRPPPERDYG